MNDPTPTIFFVAGAAKAGTTSIYHQLQQHPAVHVVPGKDEASYFCTDYGLPLTLPEYLELLLPKAAYRAAGECCHTYLTDPRSAGLIHGKFPHARIILILRNPAERAFSLYQWMAAKGYEFATDFEEALRLEPARLERNMRKQNDLIHPYKNNYLYFSSGLYARQIERYLEHFDRSQLLFLKFDALKHHPQQLMQSIHAHIGVESVQYTRMPVHNSMAIAHSPARQYFIRRRLSGLLSARRIESLLRCSLRPRQSAKFDIETRNRLLADYAADIRATQQLTGLNLSDWLPAGALASA